MFYNETITSIRPESYLLILFLALEKFDRDVLPGIDNI